jgi:hydroxycarboxylate dehydrogenase B
MPRTHLIPAVRLHTVAGEPERETRAKRMTDGIPVDDNTWNELLVSATKLGRDPSTSSRLAGVAPG